MNCFLTQSKLFLFALLLFGLPPVAFGQEIIDDFPYTESFESGGGLWTGTALSGSNNSWEVGVPDAEVIQGAADGSRAWATRLAGPFDVPEHSAALSPFFDFSGLTGLTFEAEIWYELDETFEDGVVLEVSTDFGDTWTIVGSNTPGFYNGTILDYTGNGVEEIPAWTGSSDGYVPIELSLPGLAGSAGVQFRFQLKGVVTLDRFVPVPDGFAFDHIRINGTVPDMSASTFFIDAFGSTQDVEVSLAQIGAIPNPELSEAAIADIAGSIGLQQGYEEGGIYFFNLPDPGNPGFLAQAYSQLNSSEIADNGAVGLVLPADAQSGDTPSLLTEEIILQFNEGATDTEIETVISGIGGEVLRSNPFVPNSFLVGLVQFNPFEAIELTQELTQNPAVDFAFPNFVNIVELDATLPDDQLFGDQWHLKNTGQGGGVRDADADLPEAWDFTLGDAGTIVAVVDAGFEVTHPDLSPNLWANTGEIPGDGIDNDMNGFVDDANGWDFFDGDNNPEPVGAADNHGTAVAGVAVAAGDNTLGVSGSCPDCAFMPLKLFTQGASFRASVTDFQAGLAFDYARAMGATVITNSWGLTGGTLYPYTIPALDRAAADEISVLFSGRNIAGLDICAADGIRARETSFSVSSTDNFDRWVNSHSLGDCIDILAPTRGNAGTLGITTTDRLGTDGYASGDYTAGFGGTSSATPLVAGIVGLIRSADPTLTQGATQTLIQDTGDKVEDTQGAYDARTGFSTTSTHSFGRVNAYEAVRIAAPVSQGGKGGVDVFVRDNNLDWGNTEQPSNTRFESPRGHIAHWRSVDIKIDAPPFQTPPSNSAEFDAFVDEQPSAGLNNRVYVRVRNRGPITATDITVKLMWTHWGTTFGNLPADFWVNFPADPFYPAAFPECMRFNAIDGPQVIASLPYSGATAARDAVVNGDPTLDAAEILQFDNFNPPTASDCGGSNHFCLTAIVDSPQDPVSVAAQSVFNLDQATPIDNNITHRNVAVQSTVSDVTLDERFLIRNPYNVPALFEIEAIVSNPNWMVNLNHPNLNDDNTILLPANDYAIVEIEADWFEPGEEGEILVQQVRIDVQPREILGGLVYQLTPQPTDPEGTIFAGVECPVDATQGCTTKAVVQLDMTDSDELLGNFTGKVTWNPAVLQPTGELELLSGFNGLVNLDTVNHEILFNGVSESGASGLIDIMAVEFEVVGPASSVGNVGVNFSVLASAETFESLMGQAKASYNCSFAILPPNLKGDLNGDGLVNSTDAAIMFAYATGDALPASIMDLILAGFGDIDGDGQTNAFDGLLVLSYELGIEVPFPVSTFSCPEGPDSVSPRNGDWATRMESKPVRLVLETQEVRSGYIEVPVIVDLDGAGEALGSYDGHLEWNEEVYRLVSVEGGATPGFTNPTINTTLADQGQMAVADAHPYGAKGKVHIFTARFERLATGKAADIQWRNGSMNAAQTFLPLDPGNRDTDPLLSLSAFPNPFKERLEISFELPADDWVTLRVFDRSGQQVATLVEGQQPKGNNRIRWKGTAANGRPLPNGVYYLHLQTSGGTARYRVVLMQ